MASYIQTLLSQLNHVDVNDASVTKKFQPVGKDDQVLGDCPDELKRLMVHVRHIMDRCNAMSKQVRILKIQHEGEETPPDGFDQLCAEADRLCEEFEILAKLFRFALRQHFVGSVGSGAVTIGIRQNWQVVSSNALGGGLKANLKAVLKILEDTK